VIPQARNERITVSGGKDAQASFTHVAISNFDGARGFSWAVTSSRLSSDFSQSFYIFLYATLNGWFQETSAGCKNFVQPPGMHATTVLAAFRHSFTSLVK
jgi:hypothetical protein